MEERERETKKQENSKNHWNVRPYLAMGAVAFVVITLCIAVYFVFLRFETVAAAWGTFMHILQPIIIGLVIAYLINPIMVCLENLCQKMLKNCVKEEKKRKKISRSLGTFGAVIIFILIIFLLIEMILPQLIQSISGMVVTLPEQGDKLVIWVEQVMQNNSQLAHITEEVISRVTEFLEDWVKTTFLPDIQTYVTQVTTGVISAAKVVLNVVIGVIIAIYVLFAKDTFIGQCKKMMYAFLPTSKANSLIHIVRKSHSIFGGFISGKILDSAIIGVLCYIVLSIMQMPYTLLVSVIVGVTNVIPFFGPFIGAVPSFIIIVLADPIKGLAFVVFVIILQQVDGNIIGPKILGDSTGLSPFWVVFAILVGGGLFGFAGMILGVPTFAVIYYLIGKAVRTILGRKDLPTSTTEYTGLYKVDGDSKQLIYREQTNMDDTEKNEEKTSEGK